MSNHGGLEAQVSGDLRGPAHVGDVAARGVELMRHGEERQARVLGLVRVRVPDRDAEVRSGDRNLPAQK